MKKNKNGLKLCLTGLITLMLVFLLLIGCVTGETKEQNNLNQENTLEADAIDCGENLDCLIQAVEEEKEAKAVIESDMVLFDKEYTNTDYLEIFFEEKYGANKIILFREILNKDGLSGSCEFSKEQAISFLEKWNENSFNSDYFDEFNCKGEIYDVSNDDGGFE